MFTFLASLFLLVVGYFVYGGFVDKVFRPDPSAVTPCYSKQDGADYIPMPTWKVYTVQFLNIAGTGPIFGAMMGMIYGPSAFLWIVFGCIMGGAMHDYMSGMISLRRGGSSLPEIIGDELGSQCRLVMRVVTLVLMLCVGASFVMIPARLMDSLMAPYMGDWLAGMLGPQGGYIFWVTLIFLFYLAVTVLSISKIVGNVYPVFGFALLLMAVLVGVGIFTHSGVIPEVTDAFSDHYPVSTTPLFPGLFITIACGAVSGFHATQSPMMARCLKNEKYGQRCFYGAMVTEGVVALIWAAASIKFADSFDLSTLHFPISPDIDLSTPYGKLLAILQDNEKHALDPGILVNLLCDSWLGKLGLVLAVLGVVAAPMSTGGSAFRAARLIVSDFTHYGQQTVLRRVLLSAPLFAVAILMLNVSSFKVLWLYVSWFNQVLATFTFFTITHWLLMRSRKDPAYSQSSLQRWSWVISFVPAVFMLVVSSTFILIDAGNGFGLSPLLGYSIGGAFSVLATLAFVWHCRVGLKKA